MDQIRKVEKESAKASTSTSAMVTATKRKANGHCPLVLKSPKELPYDKKKGEIVAILRLPNVHFIKRPLEPVATAGSESEEPAKAEDGGAGSVPNEEKDTKPTLGDGIVSERIYPGCELTDEEKICPKCQHSSMKVVRNLVRPRMEDPLRCIGIPLCINIKCMYISSKLRLLPTPTFVNKPIDKAAVLARLTNPGYPEKDPVLREMLREGMEMKNNPLPTKPLIDVTAIRFYRDTPVKEFEKVLKKVFDGVVPDIP